MMRSGTKTSPAGFAGLWRRFCRNRDGVAAIETAFVMPVVLIAYVGMINLAQMAMINRKVTQLTSTLSDLTARLQTAPTAEIANIFKASETIMMPYDGTKTKMMIASVVIDAKGIGRVCWASGYNGASVPARGETVSLPDSVKIASTSVIMARASYDFVPLIGKDAFAFVGNATLGDNTIYSRPRNGKPAGDSSIEQIVRSDVAGCPKF